MNRILIIATLFVFSCSKKDESPTPSTAPVNRGIMYITVRDGMYRGQLIQHPDGTITQRDVSNYQYYSLTSSCMTFTGLDSGSLVTYKYDVSGPSTTLQVAGSYTICYGQ